MTTRELAAALGCELAGNPDLEIHGVAPMEQAGPNELTFLANPKYAHKVKDSRAGAILVSQPVSGGSITSLVSSNPYLDFARALELFYRPPRPSPGIHPLAVQPIDADITAVLRGLNDFSPKPWPQRFREIQAAGGRIDISQARVQQGETTAVGAGSLSINASGRLEGQLRVTVAGLDPFLKAVGANPTVQNSPNVDRLAGALDRFMPGLGDVARQQAGPIASLGANLVGEQTTLEGRRAVTLPLRFQDGAIFLGPIPIGQSPALF